MLSDEIKANDKVAIDYQAWKNLPMTQRVIEQLQREGRVPRPNPLQVRAETALMACGENLGWHDCIIRMISLEQSAQKDAPAIEPSYGADEIMKSLTGK